MIFHLLPRSLKTSVALLLSAAALAGCTHAISDEGVPSPQPLPMNTFKISWAEQLEMTHGPITRLYSRDTYVIGYTDDGTSYVLNKANGDLPFPPVTIRNGDQALHAPVVLKDFIVYPTNTTLEVYDRGGALVRSKNLSYSIRSEATGAKNFVYFGSTYEGGGRVEAVDVTSEYRDHRWELMFPHASIVSAPAEWGDIVYCAGDNGQGANSDVAAVSYDRREPIFVFKSYGPVVADLQVDETGLYIAGTDGKLVALNRNNGKVKWQYLANDPLRDSPVLTKDLVLQKAPGVGYIAIDKLTGAYNRAPKWTAPDAVQILAADDRHVYVLRNDKLIVALDKNDGHAMFTSRRADLVAFTTSPRDGVIYAVTTANRVLAISPVLKPGVVGELAWTPVAQPLPTVALAK